MNDGHVAVPAAGLVAAARSARDWRHHDHCGAGAFPEEPGLPAQDGLLISALVRHRAVSISPAAQCRVWRFALPGRAALRDDRHCLDAAVVLDHLRWPVDRLLRLTPDRECLIHLMASIESQGFFQWRLTARWRGFRPLASPARSAKTKSCFRGSNPFTFLPIVLVVGTISIVDLRLLGVLRSISLSAALMRDVIPYTWGAFAVAAITGSLLFSSDAVHYAHNRFFQGKLVLLALGRSQHGGVSSDRRSRYRALGHGNRAHAACRKGRRNHLACCSGSRVVAFGRGSASRCTDFTMR